jgi:hypothetical protein
MNCETRDAEDDRTMHSRIWRRVDVDVRVRRSTETALRAVRERRAPTAASAERAGLVHVEPDSVKFYPKRAPVAERIRPPRFRVWRKPIGEDGVARPDLPDVFGAVRVLDECVEGVARGVRGVVVSAIVDSVGNGGIDNRNVCKSNGMNKNKKL